LDDIAGKISTRVSGAWKHVQEEHGSPLAFLVRLAHGREISNNIADNALPNGFISMALDFPH